MHRLLLITGLALAGCATAAEPERVADDSETVVVAAEAPAPVADSEAEPTTAELDPNETICRREAVAGSNFKRRVCATRAQWEATARASRDATETIQRRNRGAEPSR